MLGLSAPETGRVRPATGLQEYTGVVVIVVVGIGRLPAAFAGHRLHSVNHVMQAGYRLHSPVTGCIL